MGEGNLPFNLNYMIQVYINYTGEFEHGYNLKDEDDNSYLFRSEKSEWAEHAKGKLAASIENNGNGYKILIEGVKKFELDYAQAEELLILLIHSLDSKLEFRESKLLLKWPL